ncbi:hypothetical protein B0H14DRAFT_3698414 [Mycena olivaceomarginata]|nr:hypothetical protein B0H14DRAFT_3698414 [Mycena olivaceomarginata]
MPRGLATLHKDDLFITAPLRPDLPDICDRFDYCNLLNWSTCHLKNARYLDTYFHPQFMDFHCEQSGVGPTDYTHVRVRVLDLLRRNVGVPSTYTQTLGDRYFTRAQSLIKVVDPQHSRVKHLNRLFELLPRSITTVQLDFPILNAYAFKSGGIFAVTEPMNKAVRWVALESIGQAVPGWKRLESDKYILEFGLAVPEEDLLVVLTSTSPNIDIGTVLKMRIHELSTRCLCVRFEMDICGSKGYILMSAIHVEQSCGFLVYDGKKRPTRDDILLANIAGALELWTIQDQSDDTGPEIGLCLPEVSDGCQYHIQRVDNNPKGDTTQASQSLDYSFADSLVALSIVRIEQDGLEVQIMCLTTPGVVFCNNFPRLKTVARSVHRRNGALDRSMSPSFPPLTGLAGNGMYLPQPTALSFCSTSIHTRGRKLSSSKQNQNDRNAEPRTGQFVFMAPSELDFVDEGFGEQVHS